MISVPYPTITLPLLLVIVLATTRLLPLPIRRTRRTSTSTTPPRSVSPAPEKSPPVTRDDPLPITARTAEEIAGFGAFPDYAALSGVRLPVAYEGFVLDQAKPRPYRPFRWKYHQTMCTTPPPPPCGRTAS